MGGSNNTIDLDTFRVHFKGLWEYQRSEMRGKLSEMRVQQDRSKALAEAYSSQEYTPKTKGCFGLSKRTSTAVQPTRINPAPLARDDSGVRSMNAVVDPLRVMGVEDRLDDKVLPSASPSSSPSLVPEAAGDSAAAAAESRASASASLPGTPSID